jgi:hypothetical protein
MLSERIAIGLLSSAPRTRELSHRAIGKRRSFLAPPYSSSIAIGHTLRPCTSLLEFSVRAF